MLLETVWGTYCTFEKKIVTLVYSEADAVPGLVGRDRE